MRLSAYLNDPRPADHERAVLAGRVWNPAVSGPCVVVVRGDDLIDVSHKAPTTRDLCEMEAPAAFAGAADGASLGPLAEILANTPRETRDSSKPWLLAPIDLQAI